VVGTRTAKLIGTGAHDCIAHDDLSPGLAALNAELVVPVRVNWIVGDGTGKRAAITKPVTLGNALQPSAFQMERQRAARPVAYDQFTDFAAHEAKVIVAVLHIGD